MIQFQDWDPVSPLQSKPLQPAKPKKEAVRYYQQRFPGTDQLFVHLVEKKWHR